MGFFGKEHGAISVFLVIVLVPVLVLASIFVDLSRVRLGKSVAESAGDLTLNTAMTNYDAVLKDMYGLFAASQTEQELYDNLEEYYRQCIKAAGVGDTQTDDYVGQIMELLKSEAGSDDLLKLELAEDSFALEKPETGTLANPAILKTQIVEFMKYRAPINLGTSILDAISCLDGVQEQTEDIEAKNDFYAKRTDMMEKLEEAWSYLEDYEYRDYFPQYTDNPKDIWTFPNRELLKSNLNGLKTMLPSIDQSLHYAAAYLYYADSAYDKWSLTDKNGNATDHTIGMKDSNDKTIEKKISYTDLNGTVNTISLTNPDTVNEVAASLEPDPSNMTNIANCFRSIEEAERDLNDIDYEDISENILSLAWGGTSVLSDSDKIRLVSKAYGARIVYMDNVYKLLNGICDLWNDYYDPDYAADFDTLYIGISRDSDGSVVINTDTKKSASTPDLAKDAAKQYLNKYFGENRPADINNTEHFMKYNVFVSHVSTWKNETQAVVNEGRSYVSSTLRALYYRGNSNYTFLSEKYEKLKNALDKLEEVKKDLNDPDSEYNKALSAWKEAAGKISGSDMGDSDLKEIETLSEVLSLEKVDELVSRVKPVKEMISGLRGQVGALNILGKNWKDVISEEDYSGKGDISSVLTGLIKTYKGKTYASQLDNVSVRDHSKDAIPFQTIGKKDVYDYQTYNPIIGEYEWSRYDEYNIKLELDSLFLSITPDSLLCNIYIPGFKAEFKETDEQYPDLEKNTGELFVWMYNTFVEGDTPEEKEAELAKNYKSRARDVKSGEFTGKINNEKTNVSKDLEKSEDDANSGSEEGNTQTDKEKEAYKKTASSTKVSRSIDKITLPSTDTEYHKILETAVNAGKTNSESGSLDDVDKDNVFDQMSESFSSLSGVIELVKSGMTTLRDDLYIMDYIMEMFSYSTMEAEISVNNGDSFKGAWYTESDGVYKKTDNVSSAMLDDARTMTLVEISPNMNYMYGQEIEYIIYGGNGEKAVLKTDLTIFGLRFALDLVYAFTDGEVVSFALSTATALFGVPPLTPLIPIAKLAIIIGLALAEATYDLVELKMGKGIPLVKSTTTFVMKPSNALKTAASEVIDVAVDKGMDVLDKVISMTDEELEEYLNKNEDALKELATTSVNNSVTTLQNKAFEVVDQAFSICYDINEEFKNDVEYVRGATEEKVQKAKEKLDSWLAEQKKTDNSLVYEAKRKAVELLESNGNENLKKLFDTLEQKGGEIITTAEGETKKEIEKLLEDLRKEINKTIEDAVDTVGSELSEVKTQALDELKKAAENGAEDLKKSLKENISKNIGEGVESADTGSVVGSLLNWQYSDYLQLFVLIGLIANPETILLRTADCIELNMRLQNNDTFIRVIETVTTETTEKSRWFGIVKETVTTTKTTKEEKEGDASFKMKEAYAYLSLKADVDVKPLMLTLPLIEKAINQNTEGSWYRVEYRSTQGY